MKVPNKRKTYFVLMMLQALLIVVIEVVSIIISYNMYSLLPFVIGLIVCLGLAVLLSEYYYSGSKYSCPDCGSVIKPTRSEFMKSVHVKKGRIFNCPVCSKKVNCIEGFIKDV